MNEAPFYLAIAPSDVTTIYRTEREAMELDGFFEAYVIFHCHPDENRMRDVTEILAGQWWKEHAEIGAIVPAAYVPYLVDEIYEIDNPPRPHQREIGAEYLHNPQHFMGKF